mmetsp:Transcript_37067/g.106076  ORF Transcript_37067/g.106076 Transcript_37067/m.106076 type:complete len:292 (-) Transcript_37067:239-1114(-)
MALPSSTAATMVEKVSSANTMSLDSFATSVPVTPMATPMSASFRAGASLTPSPVMATTQSRRLSIFTICCLCRGSVRENTRPKDVAFSSAGWCSSDSRDNSCICWCSVRLSNCLPVRASACAASWVASCVCLVACVGSGSLSRMLVCRAMASAVLGLSPVIMTTLMPALRHSSIACGTSGRGGSISPTRPAHTHTHSQPVCSVSICRHVYAFPRPVHVEFVGDEDEASHVHRLRDQPTEGVDVADGVEAPPLHEYAVCRHAMLCQILCPCRRFIDGHAFAVEWRRLVSRPP